MISFRSFFWGTIVTFIEIGIFIGVLQLFSNMILGMNFIQLFSVLDSFRLTLEYQAIMTNNSFLIFVTGQKFWQILAFLIVIGIWFINVAYQDWREDRQQQ